MASRQYDVVVLGATGFTGRLISKYLARKQKSAEEERFTWAIAGRNKAKLAELQRVVESLSGTAVPSLVADTSDAKALDTVCSACTVCISCTGPFDLYGMPVVEACLRNGTHYVDITGEFTFVRRVIERYHEEAKQKGLLLISQGGFDSVPSDLANFLVFDFARTTYPKNTVRSVNAYFSNVSGGPSRGTYESSLNIMKAQTKADLSPYSLVPAEGRVGLKPSWPKVFLTYNRTIGAWTYPFVMSASNERLVRRTNYLEGTRASYSECSSSKSLIGAVVGIFAFYTLVALLVIAPLRKLIQRFLPAAGEGPSDESMAACGFSVLAVGELDDGRLIQAKVRSHLGGYPSTAVFASEIALCIARDMVAAGKPGSPSPAAGCGGALTPLASCKQLLLPRLRRNGITMSVEAKPNC